MGQFTTIQDALQAWASSVVGAQIPVIWALGGGTRPEKPFVTLNIRGPIKVPAIDHLEDDLKTLGGSRQYTVTCEVLTAVQDSTLKWEDAMQYAANLVASLDDPAIDDLLYAAGIGVGEIFVVQDLSQLLDTKFERRASFDFHINVASNYTIADLPVIETVKAPVGILTP
jgi:hypothetical protein